MNALESQFRRKLAGVSTHQYFSVVGDPRYNDDTAERIFVGVIMNPYIDDSTWRLLARDGTGLLQLEAPRTTDVNNGRVPSNSGRGSTNTTNRRKRSEVCF